MAKAKQRGPRRESRAVRIQPRRTSRASGRAVGGARARVARRGSKSKKQLLRAARPEDEEAGARCEACERADNAAEMLLCDGCDAGFHLRCLDPPLAAVPAGDWYCARCVAQFPVKYGRAPPEDVDAPHAADAQMVPELMPHMMEYYREREITASVDARYIDAHACTPRQRGTVVDWMLEVHHQFELVPESLFLAVNLLDRYLELRPVGAERLQLVGAACLLLASKFEDQCVSLSSPAADAASTADVVAPSLSRLPPTRRARPPPFARYRARAPSRISS